MAGVDVGFDAAAFRTAIRSAMAMGLPTDTSQQITFIFADVATYTAQDPGSRPYNWTSPKTADTPARRVQVPAAVQWGKGTMNDTEVGEFDTSTVTVTILDVDYALVNGCSEVEINGTRYQIDTIAPPLGLFDVTVYQLHLSAKG